MALISHGDWLDRFGDIADTGDDVDLGALRFEVVAAGSPRPCAPAPHMRSRRVRAERPLLAYRAGPPFRERRAQRRP